MGLTLPPPPLTKEEYEKRILNGARTMKEIDPEFCKWLRQGYKYRNFMRSLFAISAILLLYVLILCVINAIQ